MVQTSSYRGATPAAAYSGAGETYVFAAGRRHYLFLRSARKFSSKAGQVAHPAISAFSWAARTLGALRVSATPPGIRNSAGRTWQRVSLESASIRRPPTRPL